ncbi:MAG: hypothetical protein WC980_09005 [Candidatus Brocadiia bacterium]
MKLKIDTYKSGLLSGGVIIAVILYMGVWANYQQADEQREQLRQKGSKIDKLMTKQASTKDVERLRKYQEILDRESVVCKGYYKGKEGFSAKWFKGINIKPDGLPEPGDFKARYVDEKNQLIRKLKDNKITIGIKLEEGDQAKMEENQLGFEEPTADNLKNLQKKFWIHEMIINTMIESEILHCEKISFGVFASSPAGSGKGVQPPQLQKIPGDMGFIIPFEVMVNVHNKNAPIFIQNILNKSKNSFLILLRKIDISRVTEELANYPEIKIMEKAIPLSEKDTYKPPVSKTPPVKMVIQGEILDFDIK